MEKQNFGLTESQFNDLLLRLQMQGDETLIEIIFKTQYAPCRKLLMDKYHASYDNAHDVVMELLIQFREDLIHNKLIYNNLVSFFKTAAWQRYIHISKANRKLVFVAPAEEFQLGQIEDDSGGSDTLVATKEAMRIEPAIRKAYLQAYQSLCQYCKKIIDVYYIQNELVESSKRLTWEDMTRLLPRNECACYATARAKPQQDSQTVNAMKTQANAIRKKLKVKMEASLNAPSKTILAYLQQFIKI